MAVASFALLESSGTVNEGLEPSSLDVTEVAATGIDVWDVVVDEDEDGLDVANEVVVDADVDGKALDVEDVADVVARALSDWVILK